MAKIKGLLLDKDGTLFDFTAVWGVWCERVLGELSPDNAALTMQLAEVAGYDLQHRKFIVGSSIVNAAADETNQLWAKLLPSWSVEQIEEVGLRHLAELELAPVTDLAPLFQQIKSMGLQLGLATNDFEIAAKSQLKQSGIESYFDFICGFDSGFGSKPAPGMINEFCRVSGCAPGSVAMVGDSTHDLIAGSSAGVGLRVGVLTGPATVDDLEDYADIVLADISLLPAYLVQQGLL